MTRWLYMVPVCLISFLLLACSFADHTLFEDPVPVASVFDDDSPPVVLASMERERMVLPESGSVVATVSDVNLRVPMRHRVATRDGTRVYRF